MIIAKKREGTPKKTAGFFRKVSWLCLGGLALALLPSLFQAGLLAAPEGDKKEILKKKNQIKQIKFEQGQVKQRLHEFRSSELELLQQIELLTDRINEIKRGERDLVAKKSRLYRRGKKQQREMEKISAKISESRNQVALKLRRIYRLSKSGDSANLMALAGHKDFFKNSHYLALLIRSDQKEIQQYIELTQSLEEKQRENKKTQGELTILKKQLRQERRELNINENALRDSLRKMRKNKKLYNKYLSELEQIKRGMETALISLEKNSSLYQQSKQLSDPDKLKGSLPPPAIGDLIATFGQQDPRYKHKKFQRGIVIRVDEKSKVSAVASGRAVHAGPFRGYQELVVLDHGKGFFTIYGHLEKLGIKKGGWVAKGTTLGRVTYQPVERTYDIYFEIRVNGNPEDPLNWITPGSLSKG